MCCQMQINQKNCAAKCMWTDNMDECVLGIYYMLQNATEKDELDQCISANMKNIFVSKCRYNAAYSFGSKSKGKTFKGCSSNSIEQWGLQLHPQGIETRIVAYGSGVKPPMTTMSAPRRGRAVDRIKRKSLIKKDWNWIRFRSRECVEQLGNLFQRFDTITSGADGGSPFEISHFFSSFNPTGVWLLFMEKTT